MQVARHRALRAATRELKTVGWTLSVILIAILTIACGSGIRPTDPVTVGRFVTGTIIGVDSSGSAICLKPASGEEQLCGIPLQRPGAPRLTVGQSVGVGFH